MEQFLIIAAAHFLALLSPGPDFFLIARSSLSKGWRVASGACIGIALANGLFIVAAFVGTTALQPGSGLFVTLQLAGCIYLFYLGVLFIRHAGGTELDVSPTGGPLSSETTFTDWRRAAGMVFLSGILNPKNALFYASLAAMLTAPHASTGWKMLYGTWMFSVVLLWDLLIAILIGNPFALRHFTRALPWLERVSGIMLMMLAIGVLAVLTFTQTGWTQQAP